MPKRLAADQLHQLARLGAIARLEEIAEEAAAIRRAFPDLNDDGAARAEAPRVTGRTPRIWRMSASARRAARTRMLEYWARKKAAKVTPDAGANESPESRPASEARPARKKRAAAARTRGARKRR